VSDIQHQLRLVYSLMEGGRRGEVTVTVMVGECKGKESVQVQVNWRCFLCEGRASGCPPAQWVPRRGITGI
jgi:hypothetical protein